MADQKSFLAKYRIQFSLTVVALMVIVGVALIFYARGFKPNFKNGTIDRTGLIVATSIPTGAQVYLDNRLTSATDTNIAYLDPRTYKVKIQKDGFTTWEKDINVKADLATEIIALLFPLAPEIKPQTLTGATSPNLSPDTFKIVYGVPGERGGAFLMPLSTGPFIFRQNPKLLVPNSQSFDYSKASYTWSPDSKQIIVHFKNNEEETIANLLLDSDRTNQQPNDITGSLLSTISSWQQQIDTQAQTLLPLAPDSVKNATAEAKPKTSPSPTPLKPSPSPTTQAPDTPTTLLNYTPNGLTFSPDEDKILYRANDNRYHVYSLDKESDYTLPDFANLINISWYPDSEHLVIAQKDLISIIEADGFNNMAVYSGKFENGFVFAHPSGERLIILTTLTQPEGTPANLYAINLR